jgi:glycosyltransferase involved in cell wall biosynthesis
VVSYLLRLAFRGTHTRVILQNPDDVADFAAAHLVNPSSVRLVRGSGVDCSHFVPAASEPGTEFRILLATRLLWDKGLSEYANAASIVLRTGRRITFLLAGSADEGNPAAVPAKAVRAWSDAGLLTWVGNVVNMVELLQSVHVVVLPSYREGLPKGLLEAAACGIALVATDVPGCREVVDHEVTGLLVPVRSAEALASALCRLYDDPALRFRLGAAARKKALAEFDERLVIQNTLKVYEELWNESAPPSYARNPSGRVSSRIL